jgi:hypothetical protein
VSVGAVAHEGAGPDLWVELPRDAPPELAWIVRVVCDWLVLGVLMRTSDRDADASASCSRTELGDWRSTRKESGRTELVIS